MKTGNSTIAAVATAPGTAGIGIIRVSGDDSIQIVDTIYKAKKKLCNQKTHTIHYGRVVDPETGEELDEVLMMLMRAPHTYTGEDTVEINCHGGPYIERRILELVIRQGACPAEPGEFSKRAFLNGKMDLSQAEAVMDLISSRSRISQRASMQHLKGALAKSVEEYRVQLLDLITALEVNLEYPEYEETNLSEEAIKEKTENLLAGLTTLYNTADSGRMAREGIRTTIAGRPNVGKSSLLNRLAGQERAIVTEIPGTTRDVIEEFIDFDGIPLRIADTAGIHETEDPVERIGIERARDSMAESDLVLWVTEADHPDCDASFLKQMQDRPHLFLLNKADLTKKRTIPEVFAGEDPKNVLWISAKTGEGLSMLKDRVQDLFFAGAIEETGAAGLANLRQKEAVRRAIRSLTAVLDAIREGMPQDLLSIDFTDAYDALGEITGHSLKEDVVDEIFKRFCLGK